MRELYEAVAGEVEKVVVGQEQMTATALAAISLGGHVLLEGPPGVAKTLLAAALSRALGLDFRRVQFTPDMLPSDVTGNVALRGGELTFRRGPVFTNVLLADEINRASPRTQSALLEAMAEGQISVDGTTHRLESLFFVIATENPVEFRGTYPLPEAQMDRFALQFGLGYVAPEDEVAILSDQERGHPIDEVVPCVSIDDVVALRTQVGAVRISPELKRYVVDLVQATRAAAGVSLGASPRASLALMKAAQALALLDGGDFVTPEHVQEIALPVMAHRMVVDSQARFTGVTAQSIVEEIVKTSPVPA